MPEAHRARRIALTTLKIVGAVAALIVVLLLGVFWVLQTSWGGERLRRQAVTRINRQIEGQLDIGRLSFGGNSVVVQDVLLRDPDGNLVAQVARAEVDVRLLRLLRKEVRVALIAIDKPRLTLVSDARGLNLSRATAPRQKPAEKKAAPKPRTTEEGWVIRLDRFALTAGAVTATQTSAVRREEKVNLADLESFMTARYATGNGSLDLTFSLKGRNTVSPMVPLRLAVELGIHGNMVRFSLDGDVLGGTLRGRGELNTDQVERANAELAVAIPKLSLSGFDWGPVHIDGAMHPGSVPKLELLVAIPGIELTGKNVSPTDFNLNGRLTLADLALTAKAAHALMGGDLADLAGHGQLDFAVGGPLAGAPESWNARTKGQVERLRFTETVINGFSLDGKVAHLSKRPGEAELHVAVASVTTGTNVITKLALDAKIRQQDVTVEAKVAAPERVEVTLAAHIDDDHQGLALTRLTLGYPRAQWSSEGTARIRSADETFSLAGIRLVSKAESTTQGLSIDASRTRDRIDAHLSVDNLRLDLLPALVVDPAVHLGGKLDVDVKADGEPSHPRIVAKIRLEQGRFQGFTHLGAKVDATLADQRVDGTLGVEAPFAVMEAAYKVPVDPLAPGAPLDLRLDVTRLDVGETVRAAALKMPVDGKVTARFKLTGSADNPKVDLVVNGKDLEVRRPAVAVSRGSTGSAVGAVAVKGPEEIDIGHARVHVKYEDRDARADVDFKSAHGGALAVDVNARIDLSYPRITRPLVVSKIPISGKVVAHELDVAWISQFNERVETLGGQVNANAKLAGTVGDPQFLGDVRWKNGRVVATVPNAPAKAYPAKAYPAKAYPAKGDLRR
ncbi:MAG: AsmA family protein [Myxococcales bacterium]